MMRGEGVLACTIPQIIRTLRGREAPVFLNISVTLLVDSGFRICELRRKEWSTRPR